MSDSEQDPHVLISARVGESPKLIELPSDVARWGWVLLMGKAKLQRPSGRFASRRVLEVVLGSYRRYITDYFRVGILENVDNLCSECVESIPPDDRKPGTVIVHNWDLNQSRTTRWRRKTGTPNGHVNLSEGNIGETHGKRLTGARAMQSHSQYVDTTNGEENELAVRAGAEDDRDALDRYYELTMFRPWGQFSGDKLRGAIVEYGNAIVEEAMGREYAADHDRKTLLDRTLARLARDAERARRAPKAPRPTVPTVDPSAVRAEVARLMGRTDA